MAKMFKFKDVPHYKIGCFHDGEKYVGSTELNFNSTRGKSWIDVYTHEENGTIKEQKRILYLP